MTDKKLMRPAFRPLSILVLLSQIFLLGGPTYVLAEPLSADVEDLLHQIETTRDPREALGISPTEFNEDRIKFEFRKRISKLHPDRTQQNPRAEKATVKLNLARAAILEGKRDYWNKKYGVHFQTECPIKFSHLDPEDPIQETMKGFAIASGAFMVGITGKIYYDQANKTAEEKARDTLLFEAKRRVPESVMNHCKDLPNKDLSACFRKAQELSHVQLSFCTQFSAGYTEENLCYDEVLRLKVNDSETFDSCALPQFSLKEKLACLPFTSGHSKEERAFCDDYAHLEKRRDCLSGLPKSSPAKAEDLQACHPYYQIKQRLSCLEFTSGHSQEEQQFCKFFSAFEERKACFKSLPNEQKANPKILDSCKYYSTVRTRTQCAQISHHFSVEKVESCESKIRWEERKHCLEN